MSKVVRSKSLEFEVRQQYVAKLVDEEKLGAFSKASVKLHEQYRVEYMGMLRTLVTSVLARKIVEDKYPVTFKYQVPKNWFEMLKIHLPNWFTKRYPVEYESKSIKRTVLFTRYATYPMADIKVPEHFGKVVVHDVLSPSTYQKDKYEA